MVYSSSYLPMPVASSSLSLPRSSLQRRNGSGRRPPPRLSAISQSKHYRPYHPHGEAAVLVLTALAGVAWLVAPFGFWLHLLGSFFFFVLLPSTIIRLYWPGLRFDDVGWRRPDSPRQPLAYGLVVTVVCFLPLIIFLTAANPASLAAVDPASPWLAWLIAEGLVSLLFLTQAAFFTGLILFRLTQLIHPWAAIGIVAVILAATQLFLPGTIGLLGLPVSLALAWIAWQTKSFVPVAIIQFLLSLTFDLIVKIS